MRNVVFILTLLFSVYSKGQQKLYNVKIDSCYTLNNDTVAGHFINANIASGNIEQLIRIKFDTQSELINQNGIRTFQTHFSYLTLAKGRIENGKRIGSWNFCVARNKIISDAGYINRCSDLYSINYQNDTLTYYDRSRRKKIHYINDSLTIEGEFDLVYFECNKECLFYNKETHKLILKGKKDDLEWLIFKLEREYN